MPLTQANRCLKNTVRNFRYILSSKVITILQSTQTSSDIDKTRLQQSPSLIFLCCPTSINPLYSPRISYDYVPSSRVSTASKVSPYFFLWPAACGNHHSLRTENTWNRKGKNKSRQVSVVRGFPSPRLWCSPSSRLGFFVWIRVQEYESPQPLCGMETWVLFGLFFMIGAWWLRKIAWVPEHFCVRIWICYF